MKTCSTCSQSKELLEFNKNCKSPDGHYSICRVCTKRTAKLRYKVRDKFQYTKRMYGMSKDDIFKLAEEQQYKCVLCSREFEMYSPHSKRQFAVDHCHTTGRIRGLLCHHCNIGLGMFKDNTLALERAIQYLNENK